MKQKTVFFGSGEYTIPVLEKLISHGLDLVVTTEHNPNSPLLKFCHENNIQTISCFTASDLTNHKSLIINHTLAVLASYGAFIPDEIINLFPEGIINIHPSLLPKYKGPSPVQYALLNGETITGVTLIKLDNEIDHGPMLSQKPYNLTGNETTPDLLSILFEIGADLVEEVIIKLENDEKVTETPQDHSKESWSYKIEKKDGYIDLSNLPIDELEVRNFKFEIDRKVRSYYPWPGVWFRYPVIATKRHHKMASTLGVQSNLENKIIKLLPEDRIQVEGKNPMSYKDFINGFGEEGRELLEKLRLL